nr:MAG TPA: hypothetical protein [Caudoviricetes sp.]
MPRSKLMRDPAEDVIAEEIRNKDMRKREERRLRNAKVKVDARSR